MGRASGGYVGLRDVVRTGVMMLLLAAPAEGQRTTGEHTVDALVAASAAAEFPLRPTADPDPRLFGGFHREWGSPFGTPAKVVDLPNTTPVLPFQAEPSTYKWMGAGIGLLAGLGATYAILHVGGSTAYCDRSANQDAIGAWQCAGLTTLGGLLVAGVGAAIGSRIEKDG